MAKDTKRRQPWPASTAAPFILMWPLAGPDSWTWYVRMESCSTHHRRLKALLIAPRFISQPALWLAIGAVWPIEASLELATNTLSADAGALLAAALELGIHKAD
mgnify:FL=1